MYLTMKKIEQIQDCIEKAEQGDSKLEGAVLEIGGYTSPMLRHLMNNLGGLATKYFEVGPHYGSLFYSTTYGNENIITAVAVDNWSEFAEGRDVRSAFLGNVKLCSGKVVLFEQDCFEGDAKSLCPEPELYLYDGNHADWAHKKALTHFYDALPNEFIFCVDDSAWPAVRQGTEEGIKECAFEVLFERHLFDGQEGGRYWNGFSVYLLKKTK